MILFSLIVSLVGGATCSNMNYTGYKVIKVRFKTKAESIHLEDIAKSDSVNLWSNVKDSNESVLIQLNPNAINKVERLLTLAGISFTTVYDDLHRATEKEKLRSHSTIKISSKSKMINFDFSVYHKLEEIYRFLWNIGNIYKSLIKIICIGRSFENRQIVVAHISDQKRKGKPVVILEHGIHARNWISPATALYFIKELVTRAKTDYKEILKKYDFYIIPILNPDGYVYSHNLDRAWTKTRSKNPKYTCLGVDLNRNFDVRHCAYRMESLYRCDEFFCGEYSFSEPEAIVLRDFILERKGNIKLYISLDGSGQMWLVPYGYKRTLLRNYNYLKKLAKIGIEAITTVNGEIYKFGTIHKLLGRMSGSSIDWVYKVGKVPLAFAIRLRDKNRHKYLLPENQIVPTAEEVWAGIMAIVKAL